MKKIVFVVFFYMSVAHSQAYSEIKTGGSVPDVKLKMINHPKSEMLLSEIKNDKYLILDFWSPHCLSCIAEFPELEKFQKKYEDKLVILPVTSYGDEYEILDFYERRKKNGHPVSLPSVVIDTVLNQLFPHHSDPHEVWVDNNNKVVAITNLTAITENNIQRFIHGGAPEAVQKITRSYLDVYKPFLVNGNGGNGADFLYRSLFSGYIDSIWESGIPLIIDTSRGFKRIFMPNRDFRNFYEGIYSTRYPEIFKGASFYNLQKNGIRQDIKNTFKVNKSTRNTSLSDFEFDSYKKANVFSYELILPPSYSVSELEEYAIYDLDRFFKVHSQIKKTRVSCLKLIRKGKIFNDGLNNNKNYIRISESDSSILIVNNVPVISLITFLNSNSKLPLIVDGSTYAGLLNFSFHFNRQMRLNDLRRKLIKYGFDLVPGKVDICELQTTTDFKVRRR